MRKNTVPMELLNDDGEDLIYEVEGDAERGNPLDIVTVLTCHDAEALDGVKFNGRETAKKLREVWNAHVRSINGDDSAPADFEWLASQARMERDQGYWDVPPSGDVWWEVGHISFSCEPYQSDPGEPHETVATDWQVDGHTLPDQLVPKTRGEFRMLCRLANK